MIMLKIACVKTRKYTKSKLKFMGSSRIEKSRNYVIHNQQVLLKWQFP